MIVNEATMNYHARWQAKNALAAVDNYPRCE
jgi:hypothetical protein